MLGHLDQALGVPLDSEDEALGVALDGLDGAVLRLADDAQPGAERGGRLMVEGVHAQLRAAHQLRQATVRSQLHVVGRLAAGHLLAVFDVAQLGEMLVGCRRARR